MNRRDFCKSALIPTLSLAAGTLAVGCNQFDIDNITRYKGRRLVIIRLDGGHDSLYTFAPSKHDLLDQLRSKLYRSTTSNGIQVADWSLHPSWQALHELMLSGDARILPNVGYPEKAWSGSHFGSSDIWETGLLPGDDSPKTGWIGRLLDRQVFNQQKIAWPVINLDYQPRLFDQGQYNTGISWMGTETYSVIREYAQEYYQTNSKASEAEYKSFLLHEHLSKLLPAQGYSQTALGNQFSYAEPMIREETPVSILHITQYGYDTHVATEEVLPKLHTDLLYNLTLFVKRLKQSSIWNETQIFIYSEFGRTLDENADGGTEHGTAGHVFALGGVDLFDDGQFSIDPTLDAFDVSGNHYLKYQIDLRNILRRYEQEWFT